MVHRHSLGCQAAGFGAPRALIPFEFAAKAEEAATWYVSLFPDSRIDHVGRAPADYPGGKKGDALTVEFTQRWKARTRTNAGEIARIRP